jgi:hypothetical protein
MIAYCIYFIVVSLSMQSKKETSSCLHIIPALSTPYIRSIL